MGNKGSERDRSEKFTWKAGDFEFIPPEKAAEYKAKFLAEQEKRQRDAHKEPKK